MSGMMQGGRVTWEEFVSSVASALDMPVNNLHSEDHLVQDVPLDELSLARVVLAIRALNPYFDLPRQINIRDVTLSDLYHFCCVMDAAHVES